MSIPITDQSMPVSAEVLLQLGRIRNSREFSRKELLCRFLDYVVAETLAGRVNEIKEYTIGTRALGRPADFNPQFDACVRIHAGRLRQLLEAYYTQTGMSDPVRIQIPKGTYVPIFSWSTPSLPAAGPAESPAPALSDRKLTLAVLPFERRGPDTSLHFFPEVISEQLSIEIARFRNISVISYYSARLMAGRLTDLQQLYSEYGIHYAVTGSLQLINEHIRLNIQLIFTPSSEQVWVGTYDQPLTATPPGNIMDDVTRNIATLIAGYYGAIIHHISVAPPSLQDELLGIHNAAFWHYKYHKEYNIPTLQEARRALESTLATAPANALAWAVLGEVYLDSYLLGSYPLSIIKYSMECARKAINLDRYCLHGYQTLAWAYLLQKKRKACLRVIDECLAMNYSAANNIGWLGLTLIFLGEHERGRPLVEKAIALNPFYPWCYSFTLAIHYYAQKEYEQARYWADRINMPGLSFDLVIRIAVLGKLGLHQEGAPLTYDLRVLWPQVDEEIRSFLQKFILQEEITENILEGLNALGVGKQP